MSAPAPDAARQRLLTVEDVAERLSVSPRHVYRMADAGRIPRPLKIGAAVRWNPDAIDEWIAGGCKPVRSVKR